MLRGLEALLDAHVVQGMSYGCRWIVIGTNEMPMMCQGGVEEESEVQDMCIARVNYGEGG